MTSSCISAQLEAYCTLLMPKLMGWPASICQVDLVSFSFDWTKHLRKLFKNIFWFILDSAKFKYSINQMCSTTHLRLLVAFTSCHKGKTGSCDTGPLYTTGNQASHKKQAKDFGQHYNDFCHALFFLYTLHRWSGKPPG